MAFPVAAAMTAASTLASLFGGGQNEAELPPELRWIANFMRRQAKGLKNYGRSPALSRPDERSALAADRAQMGDLLNSKRAQGYAALGGEADQGSAGSPALGDFLSNMAGQEVTGLSSIYQNHLLNAMNERRNARYGGAAQIAQMGVGAASGPRTQPQQGPDMGAIFGQLAQAASYAQNRQNGMGAMGAAPPAPMGGIGSNAALGGLPAPAPVNTGGGTLATDQRGSETFGGAVQPWMRGFLRAGS